MNSTGLRIYVFLMMGIILSGIVTVMCLTKSINLENFYDVGAVYDVSDTEFELPGTNWNYDYEKKLIITQAENAYCTYNVKHSRKNWGFLYLSIRDLNGNTPAKIDFLGVDGEVLYTSSFELREGSSILQLQEDAVYSFRFIVQNPVSFAIQGMQFREREENIAWGQAPAVFATAFLCCFLVMALVLILMRRRRGRGRSSEGNPWLMTLQKCYAHLLERCNILVYDLTEREKSMLRRVLFLAALLLLYFSYRRGWNGNLLTQRRMVMALGVCFVCIAVLSWEHTNRAINWCNPLVGSWFAICLMCIISDFVVIKNVRNIGIFMLCAMGPFYMAWSSMKKPERLIYDLMVSFRWFYWGACFFCLFFRPLVPGVRYRGIYMNPNLFAGFLVAINIVYLTWLDENLAREKLKKHVLLENVFGLVTIWGFLQLTESLTSLAAYVMEWVMFLWKQFPTEKKKVYYQNLRRVLVLSVVSMVLVMTLGRWGISNVPGMIGTDLAFQGDRHYAAVGISLFSLKVEAAENTGLSERIIQKITSGEWYALFTGRTVVWKAYIRNWNLFGHAGNLESLNGLRTHAHNAVLQMINNYGIFIVIPYVILLYYSVKYGIMAVLHKNRRRLSLFFLLVSVSYVVLGLAEDMGTPYSYVNWLLFFIALGGMFNQQPGKTET